MLQPIPKSPARPRNALRNGSAWSRRALMAAGILAAAFSACFVAAPRVKLDPSSAAFYEKARLIMTEEEESLWRYLVTPEVRAEFIRDFWAIRDPDPDTSENEVREEFERRIDYAARHFSWNSQRPERRNARAGERGRGWNSDMGRIYIILGPPDSVRTNRDADGYAGIPDASGNPWSGMNIDIDRQQWYYSRFELHFWFRRLGTGGWMFDPDGGIPRGRLFEVMETAKLDLLGLQTPGRAGRAFQFEAGYADDGLRLAFSPRRLTFTDSAGGKVVSRIHVRVNVYRNGGKVEALERDVVLEESGDAVIDKTVLTAEIPCHPPGPGKYLLDIVARDMLAETVAMYRGLVKTTVRRP